MPVIPATVGNIKQEDHNPHQIEQKARPCLQNKQNKTGWRCGSSGRIPTSQVQNLEFKCQYYKKKNHIL
jgi:hypothetical protein